MKFMLTPPCCLKCLLYSALAVSLLTPSSSSAQSISPDFPNTHDLSQERSSSIRHWYREVGDSSDLSIQDLHEANWKPLADLHGDEHAPGIQWYRADIHLVGTLPKMSKISSEKRLAPRAGRYA